MSIQPIVQLGSPQDHSTRAVLQQPTHDVVDFGATFQQLVDDLLDTLGANQLAVGLAAPQIGSNLRVAVVDLKNDPRQSPLVIANPVATGYSGKKDVKMESCMSVPNYRGPVERRNKISVRYQDRLGKVKVIQAQGFLARVLAHEIDHLDGVLYLGRMTNESDLEYADFVTMESKLGRSKME